MHEDCNGWMKPVNEIWDTLLEIHGLSIASFPRFCFFSGKNLRGTQLPPRLRRTLRSAPTKGGEQFAVQTFEPAKWAMTMFRNLIARWHFYVSIEKFQFTFPPLANTRYKHQNKNQQQLPIERLNFNSFIIYNAMK